MKLKEAIERVDGILKGRGVAVIMQTNESQAAEIILAAARAFACETCNGSGWISQVPNQRMFDRHCPDCIDDRDKARGSVNANAIAVLAALWKCPMCGARNTTPLGVRAIHCRTCEELIRVTRITYGNGAVVERK